MPDLSTITQEDFRLAEIAKRNSIAYPADRLGPGMRKGAVLVHEVSRLITLSTNQPMIKPHKKLSEPVTPPMVACCCEPGALQGVKMRLDKLKRRPWPPVEGTLGG
jgi:hypothetical protein